MESHKHGGNFETIFNKILQVSYDFQSLSPAPCILFEEIIFDLHLTDSANIDESRGKSMVK